MNVWSSRQQRGQAGLCMEQDVVVRTQPTARRVRRWGIAALAVVGTVAAAPGNLDVTFGDGTSGRIFHAFAGAAAGPQPSAVIQLSDGKLAVTGRSSSATPLFVARFNADGTVDPTFSGDGVTGVAFAGGQAAGYALLEQPDGKLVVVGQALVRFNDFDIAVVRFNTDGSLDTTFDTDGIAILNAQGSDDYAAGVVRQTDGKLVIAGASNAGSSYDFLFARFTTAGALDTSFGTNGVTRLDFGGVDDLALGLVQQTDGALVAAGITSNVNTSAASMAVARVSASGAPDNAFDTDARSTIPFDSRRVGATSLALQADGRIVLAGSVQEGTNSTDSALARLNANGSLDTTFGTAGIASFAFGGADQFNAVLVEPSGAIVTAGGRVDGSSTPADMLIARFTNAGTLDATFGSAGTRAIDCGTAATPSSCEAFALTRLTDGRLVTAGYNNGVVPALVLARLADTAGSAGVIGLTQGSTVVSESTGTISVRVRRTGGTAGAVSVDYATADAAGGSDGSFDIARAGTDYAATSGTLTWADGDGSDRTISISVTQDTVAEVNEALDLTLSNLTGGAAGALDQQAILITDDDAPANGALQFGLGSASVDEALSGGTATFYVYRTGGSTGAVSVQYATASGTAISGTDFTAASGTLNWSAGDTDRKSITVTLTNDTDREPTENFTIALSSPTGGAVIGQNGTFTASIIDSDGSGEFNFSAATTSALESVGTITFTVQRTGGTNGAVTVDYATAGGTATSGADFTPTSGTLSWASGDAASKTFTVAVTNDTDTEAAEDFTVVLSNPTGLATLGTATVNTVTIAANDTNGLLQFTNPAPSFAEEVGNATLTVSRANGAIGAVTVQYATSAGSADSADFTATSGTLSWADGDAADKTISVPITNDSTNESAETFTVVLSNATGNATLDASSTATVTIQASDASGGGGGGGRFDWLTLCGLCGIAAFALANRRRPTGSRGV